MTPVFRHGRLRLYLLRLLDEEPRHGYEVIRLLRDRFMGVYAPSPGTIYPRLSRLEDEGLVTHDEENGRKVYRITEAGREELRSRGAELDELEEELSESVSDIAREFGEDVRATVRSLREELTRAAREVRQTERDTAREAAEAARDQVKETREQAKQAKESAWTQARQARDRARQARDEAFGHAQRLREEATQLRDDAREQFGGWGNWSEWSHWTDRPGRAAPDLAALRDFERLAKDFVSDLRSVAWDSSNLLGSEVIPVLRDIFADTLDRIRTEVLGPLNTSAASDAPQADESGSKGS
jgi:DNA-binding PadR family transcriptional regulator